MTSTFKNIALIGASGNIGQIILRGLLHASDFNVTVLTRSSSAATFPAGVIVRTSDFSSADLQEAFKGQDAVISAVGATGFADQKKYVDAAIAAGVCRFLPSEFSADTLNDTVNNLLPLFFLKKDVIEYLRSKESDSFSWTGVATSGLFDWGITNRFFQFDIASRSATIWDNGDKRFTLTNEKQLEDAVVSVLRHPEATANKYLYISSVETSQNEILAALESTTSSSWALQHTTTDAQVAEGSKKLQSGDFDGALQLVRAIPYGITPGLKSNFAKDRVLANGLLGLREESVQETIQRVVSEFKSN
ncbi:aromatic alcohol reductase [Aspergillus undulatus]|uniref:aromatic alcohol reductase n=1 Tax=Aspergillus undulatus TaxID=1810928 RepID=UPI003CCD99B3